MERGRINLRGGPGMEGGRKGAKEEISPTLCHLAADLNSKVDQYFFPSNKDCSVPYYPLFRRYLKF